MVSLCHPFLLQTPDSTALPPQVRKGRDTRIKLDGPEGQRATNYRAAKVLLMHARSLPPSWASEKMLAKAEEKMEAARGNFEVIEEDYQLVVASLFCQIVDLKDRWTKNPDLMPEGDDHERAQWLTEKSYLTIYNDILPWVGYCYKDPAAEWERISTNHSLKFLLTLYERRTFWFEVVEVFTRDLQQVFVTHALELLSAVNVDIHLGSVFWCSQTVQLDQGIGGVLHLSGVR